LDFAGIPRVRGLRDEDEQREMLALAASEKRRAKRLRRGLRTKGLTTLDLASAPEEYEALVAEYGVERLVRPRALIGEEAFAGAENKWARRELFGGDWRGRRRSEPHAD
jgi:hypothetical protein